MHKDIAAALQTEMGGEYVIRVRGGGMLLFTPGTEGAHKIIVVSGESQKYGPPDSIIAVLSLLEAAYPEYDILSE